MTASKAAAEAAAAAPAPGAKAPSGAAAEAPGAARIPAWAGVDKNDPAEAKSHPALGGTASPESSMAPLPALGPLGL